MTQPTRSQIDAMRALPAAIKAENNAAPEFMGHMYLAKKPCGRVAAAAWDWPAYTKETEKDVVAWVKRGLTIERVARHRGEPQPEWICDECRGNGCQNFPTPSPLVGADGQTQGDTQHG